MTKVYSKEYGDTTEWYKEGTEIIHREDGPSIEYFNGNKYWYQNGKLHKEDGPAIECANGTKVWCQNGKYHRVDGPALEHNSGTKYCLNDICYQDIKTDEEWIIFQIIN